MSDKKTRFGAQICSLRPAIHSMSPSLDLITNHKDPYLEEVDIVNLTLEEKVIDRFHLSP